MISPETLRFYPLFADQDANMLAQFAMLANEEEVESGYQLFFEGEIAKRFYLILDGAVVLTMNSPKIDQKTLEELEPLGKGEVIGWSSIVAPYIYKFGAYANQKSRLIAFDGEKIRNLFDDNPIFGYFFMQKLAQVIGDRLIRKCVQVMSLID
jgi:CRP/FNR family transcriptional regulator, cyclic AMP receptor protein